MNEYLYADTYFDFDQADVTRYAESVVGDLKDPKSIAIALYNAVRDDIRYNAYTFTPAPESSSASFCLNQGESYCIPKAVLLGAMCRKYGIPARVGFADVKNHLASPQFLEYLQSDIFVMHGYTDILLDGKWVKATPAFDAALCQLMGVKPLEFNGEEDSIFHAFDENGSQHMEYLKSQGTYATIPDDLIITTIKEAYPHLANASAEQTSGKSLHDDMSSHH